MAEHLKCLTQSLLLRLTKSGRDPDVREGLVTTLTVIMVRLGGNLAEHPHKIRLYIRLHDSAQRNLYRSRAALCPYWTLMAHP